MSYVDHLLCKCDTQALGTQIALYTYLNNFHKVLREGESMWAMQGASLKTAPCQ